MCSLHCLVSPSASPARWDLHSPQEWALRLSHSLDLTSSLPHHSWGWPHLLFYEGNRSQSPSVVPYCTLNKIHPLSTFCCLWRPTWPGSSVPPAPFFPLIPLFTSVASFCSSESPCMFFPASGLPHHTCLPLCLEHSSSHSFMGCLLTCWILAQLILPPGLLSAQVILCYCILFPSEHVAQLSPLRVVC